MLDFCFDVSGMFFDNPIKLWITSKKMISATVYMRLPVLWKILGANLCVPDVEYSGLHLLASGRCTSYTFGELESGSVDFLWSRYYGDL